MPHATTELGTDNIILIGNKPVMNYVLAIVTQFNNGQEQVIVRARGKAISRAVDAVEVVINKFLFYVEKQKIATCTQEVDTEDGTIHVSAIEIVMGVRKEDEKKDDRAQ